MKEAKYSVATWDMDLQRFTVQAGLTVESVNVPLWTLRRVLKELQGMGWETYRIRCPGGGRLSSPTVRVDRTDGAPVASILEGWKQ